MRWSEVAPRAWRLGPARAGPAARRRRAPARGARRAARERRQVHAASATRSSCGRAAPGSGGVLIEVAGRGLRRARGGARADLRPVRPRRRGAHALRRRRRPGPGDRRRDRQGPRRPLHGREHRRRARSSRCTCPGSRRRSAEPPRTASAARRVRLRDGFGVEPAGVHAARSRTASAWSRRPRGRRTRSRAGPGRTASLRRSASKRSRSRPERPRALPQVGILEPALIGEQELVHLPEAALERRRLGRARRRPGARDGSSGPESAGTRGGASRPASRQAQRRAVRALEVGVLDHQRRRSRPADVVVVGRRRNRRRAELAQRALGRPAPRRRRRPARPSKIRFAPGSSLGDVGLIAPLDDAVGSDDHQRALREAARVIDAEGAADRALGLEVRQLLDRHAELLAERRLRPGRVAGDAVQRRAAEP